MCGSLSELVAPCAATSAVARVRTPSVPSVTPERYQRAAVAEALDVSLYRRE